MVPQRSVHSTMVIPYYFEIYKLMPTVLAQINWVMGYFSSHVNVPKKGTTFQYAPCSTPPRSEKY